MKSYLAFATVCTLAAPAFAGGPVETPDEPQPAAEAAAPGYDWTGFYAGLSAFNGAYSDDGGATDAGTDGFGLQAGYLRDFGSLVLGGELAHVRGNYEGSDDGWNATRLKAIAGYDAGRVLPYGFVGVSKYNVEGLDLSDTVPIYGIGARFALSSRWVAGLEYLVQKKDNFGGAPGIDMDDNDLSLRLDYRF